MIPRDRASSSEEIAEDHVIIFLLQKTTQFVPDLRPAVFSDPVRLAGENAANVMAELAEAPGRRQIQRDTDDMVEDTLEFRVKVVLVRAVKREKRDRVMARQFPKNVVAADFAPGIRGDQSAGLYPKNLHKLKLPADAFVCGCCIKATSLLQIHQVYDDVILAEMSAQCFLVESASCDHDHVCVLQHLLEAGAQQRTNMRNYLLNVLAIGADEPAQRDVVIPDLDLAALTEQALDQLHLRALAQVVRRGFETQTQHGNVAFSGLQNHFHGALQMSFVTGQDGFEQGQLEVEFLGAIVERAHVLGQTGATEGEAGLEITGRDVELGIGSEDFDDSFRVHAEFFGQRAHFIRESYFHRVPGIADVLHHLRGTERSLEDSARRPRVEFAQQGAVGGIGGADNCHRRFQEVSDGCAFSHEFGIYADPEIFPHALTAGFLKCRNDDGFRCSGQYGAPQHDQVKRVFFLESFADLAADRFDVPQIELAIAQAGRAHT